MYQMKNTTGIASVDKELTALISYINRQNGSSGVTASATSYPITPDGGFYITGTNEMGYKLPRGYLVKASTTSNGQFLICNENEWNVSGVVYEDSNPGTQIKVVVSGHVYVYFNSNGVARGDFFRMSRTDDTANNDAGKAQSQSSKPDALWLKGFAHYSLAGEGLALCSVLR